MCMKIRLIIIGVLAMLTLSVQAQESQLQQQFVRELTAKNEGVNTIKCRFAQVREMAVLANAVKKEGDFYFRKPGNIALLFKDGDHVKMNDAWFEVKMAGKTNAMKITSNPMLRNLNTILSACIVGDMEQMTKGFKVAIEQSSSEWVIKMTPQQGGAAAKVSQITICFDRKTMSLNSMKMEEKSGDYTAYLFTNKQFNVEFDNKVFNISK